MALTQTRFPTFVDSNYLLGGSIEWLDSSNAISDNGQNAHAQLGPGDTTEALFAFRFQFDIPTTATIQNIVVRIRNKSLELFEGPTLVTGTTRDYEVKLVQFGIAKGTNKANTITDWTPDYSDVIYGHPTLDPDPLWSLTWTPETINNNGFGVALAATGTHATELYAEPRVDTFEITVHYITEHFIVPEGGAAVHSEPSVVDPHIMAGGISGASPSQSEFIDSYYSPPVSGAALMNGAASIAYSVVIDGGVIGGGVADESHDAANVSSGGISASGEADVEFYDIVATSGGVNTGGNSTAHNFYGPLGGALIDGTAQVKSDYTPTEGSALLGGEVIPFGTSNEPRDGVPAAVLVGGSSQRSSTSNWSYEGGGHVLLGTATRYGTGEVNVSASGGIYISNILAPIVTNVRFFKDLKFEWRTKAYIYKDLTFLWNTGQLSIYWYRVIGKGRQGDECDLKADPCCQKFIVNIHARTAAELCEKLSERNWNWPIDSVQQFTRPAETDLAQEYIDEYGECNELIPVEVCDIPQCADFCVDHDLRVTFNFSMKQSMDAFYVFEAGDGTPEARSVFVSGVADTVLDKNLPDYFHSPIITDEIIDDDGSRQLHLSGEAQASPSHMSLGGGGVSLGGESQVGFPRHEFVGGQWPSQTTFTPASDSYSWSVSGSGLSPWNYPERVLTADGTNSESDLSFRYASEYLIVHDLKLNLPEDINVLGVKVYVHRWSVQTAIRDLTLQLMDGTSAYSNNLARPAFRWPLLPTTAWYGSDGFDESDPFEPLDGTWDVSILNSSDFGIALQAEEFANNPGSMAYVDYFSLEVFYEYATNQVLRIGGSSVVKSDVYSVEGNGGITLGSEPGSGNYRFSLKYLPTGIGLNQPTSFVITGSHATKLYYEVAEHNTVWWDKGDPVVEANKGTVAYWANDATNQFIQEFDPDSEGVIPGNPWNHPEDALEADLDYAYTSDLYGVMSQSEMLVVRNIDLDLDPHFKIHGLRIIIANRYSTKPQVYENNAFLVRGNSVISDNFASSQIWGQIPETVEYGSNGFDGSSQLRNIELNPWDVDDINDPNFGFAISVANLDDTLDCIAKVDGVAFELTIEAFAREEVEQPHIRIMGSADVVADPHISQGGLSAGGFAEVKPYWVTMDGGISSGGTSGLVDDWVYEVGDGTWDGTDDMWHIRMGGSSGAYSANQSYNSFGGAIGSGAARVSSNRFDYTSDGNAIFILGSAGQKGADLTTSVVQIGGSMTVLGVGGVYTEVEEDTVEIQPLIGTVPSCGCLAVPLSIAMRQNLNHRNIFTQFLIRNDLHLDDDLELFYNVPNDSWQYNAHFKGYSADANTQEKWDLVFAVQCTDDMGGVNIGRRIWKMGISIFRENLTTGEDFDTRIVFGVMPEAICDTNANELNFEMTYNTQMGFATVTPENAIIYQSTIYDNIGMFKNQYWVGSPNLVIAVSQSGFALPQTRYDVYSSVVQPDESVPVPSS